MEITLKSSQLNPNRLLILGVGLGFLLFVGTLIFFRFSARGAGATTPTAIAEPPRLIYLFNGVRDDGKKGASDRKAATSIHCTNISSGLAQIEIQIYQWNGTDVYTATVSIPANRSATFSTQNTSIYFEDLIVGGSPGTDAINQGSGRILSDTPEIMCTGQVIDPLNFPPQFAVRLKMFQADGTPVGDSREVYLPAVSRP